MADDFLEELGIDSEETQDNSEQVNKIEKRISELNKKVILTAKERDDLAKAKEELQLEKDTAIKERDFYAGFADSIAKYPGANEYKEAIKEKVLAGYDPEDATIAVLAKEGKYAPQVQEAQAEVQESPVGGSAVNQMNLKGEKAPQEMNREELRAALVEAEKRGELSI
jgi:hypothetical protein